MHADDSGEETNKGRPSRGRKRKYEYSDADRKKGGIVTWCIPNDVEKKLNTRNSSDSTTAIAEKNVQAMFQTVVTKIKPVNVSLECILKSQFDTISCASLLSNMIIVRLRSANLPRAIHVVCLLCLRLSGLCQFTEFLFTFHVFQTFHVSSGNEYSNRLRRSFTIGHGHY